MTLILSSLLNSVVFGLAALAVLVLSSHQAVKKLIRLSNYFNVSTTFMGATIVSVATSIPEISSHIVGSVGILRGTLDYKIGSAIVLGANIGSDVIQQTFILGLVVFLAGTLYFRRYFLYKTMIPMIGTTIMCIIFGWDRSYSRLDGFIFLATFLGYMYYLYVDERKYYKKEEQEEIDMPKSTKEAWVDTAVALVMMGLTILSAQMVLTMTQNIVEETGIGGSLIGVITLGVASALPEFATAVSGVVNKNHWISIGTLVGSNITNPLLAIGGGALISTYWAPGPLLYWDLPWETVTGLILWIILIVQKGKIGRKGAFWLIGLYFAYVSLRMVFFAID